MIKILVTGEPVSQARPRFTTRGGYPKAYNTQAVNAQKKLIQNVAITTVDEPLTGALSVTLIFSKRPPKALKNKWTREKPTRRPDLDNYIKLALDALNGIAWLDDSQIVQLNAVKRYSDTPSTEIIVEQLGGVERD